MDHFGRSPSLYVQDGMKTWLLTLLANAQPDTTFTLCGIFAPQSSVRLGASVACKGGLVLSIAMPSTQPALQSALVVLIRPAAVR